MDSLGEQPLQPKAETKDQNEIQVLFELIEKMLQKKQQQVYRDFKKKHKKLLTWAASNQYQLLNLKNNLANYLVASGFSTFLIVGAALPSAPGSPQAQVLPPSMGSATTQLATPSASPSLTITSLKQLAATHSATSTSMPSPAKASDGQATPKPSRSNETNTTLAHSQNPLVDIQAKLADYKNWPSEQGEGDISALVTAKTGVPSKAVLDNHKMNKLVGLIGGEQHLYRYPGDTLEQHALSEDDKKMYLPSGIAPGLGAWGYFAPSKAFFTKQDEQRERYYIAAQTFLFPGFYSDKEFKNWLKFRKIIVYNPATGQAVVAVIGDSGPATYTGKSFGGSPEVMHYVGLATGSRKGEVIVLFVDDPGGKIPLGPVQSK